MTIVEFFLATLLITENTVILLIAYLTRQTSRSDSFGEDATRAMRRLT